MPFEDRTPSGTRVFKESDIETLKIVECLKSTGMPITENKTFLNGVLRGIPP
jgi:DNA-binding transcriptional MerR regulator